MKYALFAGVLLCLVGCSSGDGRMKVSGAVTLKNAPLDQGTIQFMPTDAQGSFSGTTISNGKYSIPAEQGLLPGKYKVIISSGVPNSVSTPEEAPGNSLRPPAKERIPKEFNSESTQVITITAGAKTEFNFDIP